MQTISILLENKPGALLRVTGVLSARGYNIESLTVAKTLDPQLSRMTIVVDVEDRIRTQVVKQINKLRDWPFATARCPFDQLVAGIEGKAGPNAALPAERPSGRSWTSGLPTWQ